MGKRPLGSGPRREDETNKKKVNTVDKVEGSVETTNGDELPSGWQKCFDSSSQEEYYWNQVTNEVSWDIPTLKKKNLEPNFEDAIEDTALKELDFKNPGFLNDWTQLCQYHSKNSTAASQSVSNIQLQTRLKDWQDGGLSSSFFCIRIRQMLLEVCPDGIEDRKEISETIVTKEKDIKSSALMFSNEKVFSTSQISSLFTGIGERQIRDLGKNYYMATFRNARACKCSIRQVIDEKVEATTGWFLTKCGLYIRPLEETDLTEDCKMTPIDIF